MLEFAKVSATSKRRCQMLLGTSVKESMIWVIPRSRDLVSPWTVFKLLSANPAIASAVNTPTRELNKSLVRIEARVRVVDFACGPSGATLRGTLVAGELSAGAVVLGSSVVSVIGT